MQNLLCVVIFHFQLINDFKIKDQGLIANKNATKFHKNLQFLKKGITFQFSLPKKLSHNYEVEKRPVTNAKNIVIYEIISRLI